MNDPYMNHLSSVFPSKSFGKGWSCFLNGWMFFWCIVFLVFLNESRLNEFPVPVKCQVKYILYITLLGIAFDSENRKCTRNFKIACIRRWCKYFDLIYVKSVEWYRDYFYIDGRALIVKRSFKVLFTLVVRHKPPQNFNSVWQGVVVFGHQLDALCLKLLKIFLKTIQRVYYSMIVDYHYQRCWY